MTRRYYEEEMQYLQDAAKVFADAHPEQAQHLNIDEVSDRDPYVERLFEGFAFLSGRIHERLDDEMPEYTESLLQLLCPQFLKPVPALSIVKFTPERGVVQDTTVLEEGTEVRSEPVGPRDQRCRFTTTQDVRLNPLRMEDVTIAYPGDGTSTVTLRFSVDRGVDASQLELDPLRLYFRAEPSIASTMHLYFTRRSSYVNLRSGEDDESTALRGDQSICPGGLSLTDSILPHESRSFSGFRLLQEYLCFRRKFWFVDLYGFDRLSVRDEATEIEVEVGFDSVYPEERHFDAENIHLYCAPVVNLFEADAEPIRVTGEVSEHRVVPSNRQDESIETYDVRTVVGTEDVTGNRHTYDPFFSFRHCTEDDRSKEEAARFYTTSRRTGPAGRPEVYLSLSDAHLQTLTEVPAETLTVELRCTNGTLPREEVKQGMLTKLAPEVPDVASPRNLTGPTLIRHPPDKDEDDYFWKLISHWSMNYQSIARTRALRGLLELYDWKGGAANEKRINALRHVEWLQKDILEDGAILRGTEVTLHVEEGHFADEGDLCLFGLVMSRFLSRYATINSFVHLTIETKPSEQRYQWKPGRGSRPNL